MLYFFLNPSICHRIALSEWRRLEARSPALSTIPCTIVLCNLQHILTMIKPATLMLISRNKVNTIAIASIERGRQAGSHNRKAL